MKQKPEFRYLYSPVFLISLVLLLLNDHYLKYQFPGFLTGKLSDFAGLVVFALFGFIFFPTRKKLVLLSTGLVFIFWKSPLSSPFIEWLNGWTNLNSQRVVDYSDLVALIVLFPLFYYFPNVRVFSLRSVTTPLLLFLAAFSIVATSRGQVFRVSYFVQVRQDWKIKKTEEQLLEKFREMEIEYYRDTTVGEGFEGHYYTLLNVDLGYQDTVPIIHCQIQRVKNFSKIYITSLEWPKRSQSVPLRYIQGAAKIKRKIRRLYQAKLKYYFIPALKRQ